MIPQRLADLAQSDESRHESESESASTYVLFIQSHFKHNIIIANSAVYIANQKRNCRHFQPTMNRWVYEVIELANEKLT